VSAPPTASPAGPAAPTVAAVDATGPARPLPLDDDELVSCVACGLCLPHCPTYRVTGLEIASPRGRIAAMRAVQRGDIPIAGAFEQAMEECVQCRGCEAACPSGVPFGHLMEGARQALHEHRRRERPLLRRVAEWFGYRVALPHHGLLVAASWITAIGQRLRLVPSRFGVPRIDMRELARPLSATPGDATAILFTGCVMDTWMRSTHRNAQRLLEACGARVRPSGGAAPCCGALHVHAGRVGEARRLAQRTMRALAGDAPIVVDSAGCGAALKDYGHLLGTPEAAAFSARVHDLGEWLDAHGPLPVRETGEPIVVQEPCHLRHVQRAAAPTRRALAAAYDVHDTDDDGLCCGAGGAYSALQPTLAGAVRDRKVAALRRAGGGRALVVASANPGCIGHLRAAGVDARHPADLLAAALDPAVGRPPGAPRGR
jgi:glycolate oxidase iron-sulfur subunit